MPAKDRDKRRATWNAWYQRTKKQRRTPERVEHERVTKRDRRHALVAWFKEMKDQLACKRCGECHPACIVFHHADPNEKEVAVATAVRIGWGRKRILAEAAKCEVLCINCHMKHHAEERHRGR